jgi:hypothetical protein
VPEREQAGEPEEQVVRQRDAAEDEHEAQQLQRPGVVERRAEDAVRVE